MMQWVKLLWAIKWCMRYTVINNFVSYYMPSCVVLFCFLSDTCNENINMLLILKYELLCGYYLYILLLPAMC
jgi:hypothetical protein